MTATGLNKLNIKNAGRVVILDSVDSTNNYCKESINCFSEEELMKGVLVTAHEQTGGRGRLGRTWFSGDDSIAMSVLVNPGLELSECPMVTIPAALAVRDGIKEATGIDYRIKWPNDIVIEKDGSVRKVAGILCEAVNGKSPCVIIGTGINVRECECPEEIKDRITTIERDGCISDRDTIIEAVFEKLMKGLRALASEKTLQSIKEEYESKCICIGRAIETTGYNNPGEIIKGTGKGIDELGRLMIESRSGVTVLDSGEISISYKI